MNPHNYFASLLLLVTACQGHHEQQKAVYEARRNTAPDYRIVVIENCEYLRMETTPNYAVLTHKGNCRNPIHIYRDTVATFPSTSQFRR